MSAPRVVVLDLDNTLVKLDVDWGAVKERLERLAEDAGADVEDEGIWPLMEAAQQPGREPLLADMERLVTEAELAGAGGPRNQALVDWLDANADGRPVSVLSLNSRRAVAQALDAHGLTERVAHIVGREDVRRVKPDPEGMLILAERHGVEPAAILFVGDKDGDRECAEQAGARFLHVEEIGVEWRS
ncbi:MAG: phosphoglycolate phosphatase [Thermoleophilaceae bacterium]|nr:phosphoglycolate phosphatase [Thermoleophilaceae bacterium]